MSANGLDASPGCHRPAVTSIGFDRHKYGRHLLIDAAGIRSTPGFITTPRPHRLTFYEIALITDGRGFLDLDGAAFDVGPYRLFITEPGEIRRWRLERPGLDGLIAFFEADFVNEFFGDPCFLEKLPIVAAAARHRSLLVKKKAFGDLLGIVSSMCDELKSVQADSCHALRAQTYALLIALQRLGGSPALAPVDQARTLARRFTRLVNERFTRSEKVSHYAGLLGVTERHLNHCVRAATGQTASETIHMRLFLEARRLLLHTDLSVAAIAEQLNFSDASYFIRFFKRHAAATPRTFRVEHGSPIFSPKPDLLRRQH